VEDPYEQLGVEATATVAEMRRAYRQRAHQLHPDHQPDAAPTDLAAALQATARLNQAWEILSDPSRRARYDASVSGGTGLADDEPARTTDPSPHRDAPRRRISMLPWLVLAAVMLAIFVFTAYAGPRSTVSRPPAPAGSAVTSTAP
jgi:curved DNA-binding protein CbpA